MRVGCFFFPHFPVQVEVRDDNSLLGKPIIIGGLPYQRKVVYGASEEALQYSIKQGTPLREAFSLCPQGLFLPLNEEKYVNAFATILTLLANHSPVVEAGAIGSAFIDLSYEHNEFQFVKELGQLVEKQLGLYPSISIASVKFVAWVAAMNAKPGQPIVVPEGKERGFLKDLSVNLLPASAKTLRQLELLGIHQMEQLANLPLEAVSLEFGNEGKQVWELSNGIDRTRLTPWSDFSTLKGQLHFEPPANSLSQLLAGAHELLDKLGRQLKEHWQYCHRLTMYLFFANGHILQQVFHFKEATSSEETMLRHLRQYLENARFIAPAIEMRLSLSDFCHEEGEQTSLLNGPTKQQQRLASGINWLKQKYGEGVIKKVLPKPNAVLPEDSFFFTEFNP